MAKLLHEYNDVFSSGDHDVGLTRAVRHEIPLAVETIPIRQPTRRLGPEKEKVRRQVRDLLDRGLIEPAHSAWSSPIVLVRKKDGSWQFCVDYRKLNSVTIQVAYPLSRIDESLDALAGSKYFSTLDLLSGYWQVPLDTRSMHHLPPAHTVPRPRTQPRVVLHRVDVPPRKRSPSLISSSSRKRWCNLPRLLGTPPSPETFGKSSKRSMILNRKYID